MRLALALLLLAGCDADDAGATPEDGAQGEGAAEGEEEGGEGVDGEGEEEGGEGFDGEGEEEGGEGFDGEGEEEGGEGFDGEGEGESARIPVDEPRTWRSTPTYDRGATEGNILKGFFANHGWGAPQTDFPTSMEFAYVSFAELAPTQDAGRAEVEAVVEPLLVAAAARGNHLVIRPYLDYPSLPSGIPNWLAEAGVEIRPYDGEGGGTSPDYEAPELRAAFASFIEAFGASFDGDPRLGIVQLGLLGHWGEWHTYLNEAWMASDAVQDEVLRAYEAAFPMTHLVVRYPVGASPTLDIGFHDDSFAHSTLGEPNWFFLPQLEAAGATERWRSVPIGGEIRPELQPRVFAADWDPAAEQFGQDYLECVRQTHASWMLNYHAFNGDQGVGYVGDDLRRARDGALALGWEITVAGVQVSAQDFDDDTVDLEVTVDLRNSGVAPFYYPLDLVVTANCCGVERTLSVEDLMPSETEAKPHSVTLRGLRPDDPGAASVTLALSTPMKLAGQRMAFANERVDTEGRLVVSAPLLEIPDE